MTQRRQPRQDDNQIDQLVLAKLDALTENFNEFKLTVSTTLAELSVKVEAQPKIDQQSFVNIKEANTSCQANSNKRFSAIEKRQDAHEDEARRNTWGLLLLALGFIANIVYGLINGK